MRERERKNPGNAETDSRHSTTGRGGITDTSRDKYIDLTLNLASDICQIDAVSLASSVIVADGVLTHFVTPADCFLIDEATVYNKLTLFKETCVYSGSCQNVSSLFYI